MNYNKMTTSLSLNHKSDNKKLTINLSTNYGADKTNSTVTYSIIPLAFELPLMLPLYLTMMEASTGNNGLIQIGITLYQENITHLKPKYKIL